MYVQFGFLALVALSFSHCAQGLHILLNNDDGWAAANIRETYRLLKAAGHDVIMVAPVINNSGQGGRASFTKKANLTSNGHFDSVLAGAPSVGSDPDDPNIWYYEGTPAACTFVGLDYVLPLLWPGIKPDLVVAGPNVGQNMGPFLYTLSGTVGATYAAVNRNIPAIAFSTGHNGGHRYYKWVNETTGAGLKDPATISAELTVKFVNHLANGTAKGQRLLPLGYGLSVNIPSITSFKNDSCIDPPFVHTRLTGGALVDHAKYDKKTGVFRYGGLLTKGANRCINGNCQLPGETDVVKGGCRTAVSVVTVDYDAPSGVETQGVRARLGPLVRWWNGDPSKRRGEVAEEILSRVVPRRRG